MPGVGLATPAEERKAVACSRPLDPARLKETPGGKKPADTKAHPDVTPCRDTIKKNLLAFSQILSVTMCNLNPIYERELTKLDVHQGEGRWNVSKDGAYCTIHHHHHVLY